MDNPSLGVQDLEAVLKIIDACAERGAFKGNELAAVGNIRDKVSAFVEFNRPAEPEEPTMDDATDREDGPGDEVE